MDEEAKEYLAALIHNEKVRKKMIKNKGKILDDEGKEILIGDTVNYDLSNIRFSNHE